MLSLTPALLTKALPGLAYRQPVASPRFSGTDPAAFLGETVANSSGTSYTFRQILAFCLSKKAECDGQPGEKGVPDASRNYPSRYLMLLHQELGFTKAPALMSVMERLKNEGYFQNDGSEQKFAKLSLTDKADKSSPAASSSTAPEAPPAAVKTAASTSSVAKPVAAASAEAAVKTAATTAKKIVPTSAIQQIDPRIEANGFENFVVDMLDEARRGIYTPLIGRQDVLQKMSRTLKRRTTKNIMLVGDPGVGKTAIVEGLAMNILKQQAGDLNKYKLWKIDPNGLFSGTSSQGELEGRIKKLVEFLTNNPDVIAFVDEGHWMVNPQQGLDISTMLRPFLGRRFSRMIVSITDSEYRKVLSKDASLDRRLRKIDVAPPSPEETLEILEGIKTDFESEHGVKYATPILKEAVRLAKNYIQDKQFPVKAIDVMDDAGVLAAEAGLPEVTSEHIAQVISNLTGIPLGSLMESEREKLLRLEETLHGRVIGQERAIKAVSQAIRTRRAGLTLNNDGPIASFVFMGPTGVGKTELAKALSEWMTGSDDNVTRIDMTEYMEPHSVARLIGAPPGYVGFEEGGQLTEKIRRKPYGVILLDEMEKANPAVMNALIPLLDEGRLTDGQGRTVDARNCIIIMTSNAGSGEVTKMLASRGITSASGAVELPGTELQRDIDGLNKKAIEKHLAPEILNRLDDVITFNALTPQQQSDIVNLNLAKFEKEVKDAKGLTITLNDEARDFLRNQLFEQSSSTHDRKGGRKAKSVISSHVKTPLANYVLEHKPASGETLDGIYNLEDALIQFVPQTLVKTPPPKPPKKIKPGSQAV